MLNELPVLGSLKKVGNFEKKPRSWEYVPSANPRKKLSVCMVEPGEEENRGSIGCTFVMNAARAAGFEIDYLEPDSAKTGYDVELISVHHCTDFVPLSRLKRRAPIRIVGGHPTVNNVRPAIPFGDIFCIGEGEEWIGWVLDALARGQSLDTIANFPGTLVRQFHKMGDYIPMSLTVNPLPKHKPYLNRPGNGHAANWYIEMARGCPYACHYCELGHAWKYRMADTDYLIEQIDMIDKKQSNKVTLFAPDEASHPGYGAALRHIAKRKLVTSFGSMRLDQIMRGELPLPKNMLIRVGLDGLSEETRFRVGRKQTDDDVVEYFQFMVDRGNVQFKIFMVFCYPWDTIEDFEKWELLMWRIANIRTPRNINCRIKFTPFIPQPSTPLGKEPPSYNHDLIQRAKDWFKMHGTPKHSPGWYFVNDGIMSERSHTIQCALTLGTEDLITSGVDLDAYECLKGYRI